MAAINSDLKHVLDNVHYLADGKEIILKENIKFILKNSKDNNTQFEINRVFKKSGCYYIEDNFKNKYTISKLSPLFQYSLYYNLLSMVDSRYKYTNKDMYPFESLEI